MEIRDILLVMLIAVAVGGIAQVFLYPLLSGEKRAEKRQQALMAKTPNQRVERVPRDSAQRRDQIVQTLREIEEKRGRNKASLEERIAHAGLDWTKSRFFLMSAALGLLVGLFLFILTGGSLIVAGLGTFAGGLGLPNWILGYLAKKRIEKFITELPDAMDIIVRGIRAGLPLGDCMREIAASADEPIRSEFRLVTESQAMGVTLSDALERMAERVPVAESSFFATVITIQTKAGGNLSEAIGNLSRVLRERKKMKGKIQAMSMEAKASAAIIAALPFIVALMTYISSPSYIELLWLTLTGKIVLGVCAVWMLFGVMVMKNMISFDI